jgi:glutaredoxin/uncharacterized membrane protein YhaH (DUF805 family)
MPMEEQNQLVFYGEILPGHDVEIVKAKLAELLKLTADQVANVFSGRKVVLRKSLPSEQAVSYVARLEKMGVKVFAEPLTAAVPVTAAPAPLPADAPVVAPPMASVAAAETVSPPPAPARAIAEPVVEEMECPKCGERQPKRTLCRACSVDMKRFVEAQQQAEQQAKEEKALEREIARSGGTRIARGETFVGEPEKFSFFSLDFSGRMGRTNYLVSGWFFLSALLMLAIWLAAKTDIWTIAVLAIIASMVLGFRYTILRCHDANWSGWLSLILFIPYVGGLFGLILLIMPGTRGDNNYGTATRRVGWPMGLGMIAVCGLSVFLLAGQAMTVYQAYLVKSGGSMQMQRAQKMSGNKVLTVAEADVEMFTTTDCGVCHMAKVYMNQHGITYAEKNVEKNEDYLREFYARGGRGVPYIFVGDRSMEGFDANRLEQMLADAR